MLWQLSKDQVAQEIQYKKTNHHENILPPLFPSHRSSSHPHTNSFTLTLGSNWKGGPSFFYGVGVGVGVGVEIGVGVGVGVGVEIGIGVGIGVGFLFHNLAGGVVEREVFFFSSMNPFL